MENHIDCKFKIKSFPNPSHEIYRYLRIISAKNLMISISDLLQKKFDIFIYFKKNNTPLKTKIRKAFICNFIFKKFICENIAC